MSAASSSVAVSGSPYDAWISSLRENPETARMKLATSDPGLAASIIRTLADDVKRGQARDICFAALPIISNSELLSKEKERLFRIMIKRNLFRNNDSNNALLFEAALLQKDEKLMKWLLKTVIDPYKKSETGENVLHEICARGTPQMICDAIKHCLKIAKKKENSDKENPLFAFTAHKSLFYKNSQGKRVTPLRILPYRADFCQIVRLIKSNKLEKKVHDILYETRSIEDDIIMDGVFWFRKNSSGLYAVPLVEAFALLALYPGRAGINLTDEKLFRNLAFACQRKDVKVIDLILEGWFYNHDTLSSEGAKHCKKALKWALENNQFPLFAVLLTDDRFLGCRNFPTPSLKWVYEALKKCAQNHAHLYIKNVLQCLTNRKKLVDSNGNSAIFHAVEAKDIAFLNVACNDQNQLKLINNRNRKGETPLSQAVKIGFVDGIETLIRNGALVSNDEEWTDILDLLIDEGNMFAVNYILVNCRHIPTRPLAKPESLIQRALNPVIIELDVIENFLNSGYYTLFEKSYLSNFVFVASFPAILKLAIADHRFSLASRLTPYISVSQTLAEYLFNFLCQQIKLENVEGVNYILGKEKNINYVDTNGNTLLHFASIAGNSEIFQRVLGVSDKAILNIPNAQGKTPLILAVLGGHYKIAETFYQKGLKLKKDELRKIMKKANRKFHTDTLYLLMRKHPTYFKTATRFHAYLFSKAVSAKPIHAEMLKQVLDYGFIPALKENETESLLMQLTSENEFELVDRFLSFLWLSPEQKTEFTNNALIVACYRGNSELVRVLLNHCERFINRGFGETLLIMSLQKHSSERLKIIRMLIERGIDLNEYLPFPALDEETEEMTPLMYEAGYGTIEGLELLLELGAHINHQSNPSVETAYERALLEGRYDNAFYLREKGADTELKLVPVYAKSDELILIAAALGSEDLLNVALSNKGRIKILDNDRNTPLHLAAKYGQLSMVEFFLRNDPSSLNRENNREETPLHLAALRGQDAVIEILERSGADVTLVDASGHTAKQHRINWALPVNRSLLNQAGEAKFTIPRAPKRATFGKLLNLAKSLIPDEDDRLELSLRFLRLAVLVNRIQTEADYLSVPQNPREKKIWYATLSNNLRYLTHLLSSATPELQKASIRDLALASEMCGSAWMSETKTQIELLKNPDKLIQSSSPYVQIYTILQSYKLWVVSELQAKYESLPEQEAMGMGQHIQMYLEKHLSPLLGFEGIDSRIKDPLEPTILNRVNLMDNFLEIYTYTHIHEWLREEIHIRMKPSEIYALFGGYLTHWVENHKEIVAQCMACSLSELENQLEEDYDWVNNHLFNTSDPKYVLNDLGVLILLLATGIIQHRGY